MSGGLLLLGALLCDGGVGLEQIQELFLFGGSQAVEESVHAVVVLDPLPFHKVSHPCAQPVGSQGAIEAGLAGVALEAEEKLHQDFLNLGGGGIHTGADGLSVPLGQKDNSDFLRCLDIEIDARVRDSLKLCGQFPGVGQLNVALVGAAGAVDLTGVEAEALDAVHVVVDIHGVYLLMF